jgi:hypothetical protein
MNYFKLKASAWNFIFNSVSNSVYNSVAIAVSSSVSVSVRNAVPWATVYLHISKKINEQL